MDDIPRPTMPILRSALCLALAGAVAAPAASAQRAAAAPPTLVVLLVVDQLRADYLARFGPQLQGGLARLAREGAYFTRAFQDHAITETAPGHATTLSGRYPSSTGIIRNAEGVVDPRTALVGAPGTGASPTRFRGTTLFDWMQARWPGSRALSISGKDRASILPVGRARQHVYWLTRGVVTTSAWYRDSLPGWVDRFNDEAMAFAEPGVVWTLLRPAADYPEPDSMPYETAGRDVVFPHAGGPRPAEGWPMPLPHPWMDSLILAFALRGTDTLGLGRGPSPDLLVVSLSATDFVGHAWGPDSREIHDQVLRLDHWLGVFLDSLARLRDPRRTLMVLTADHGVTSFPEWAVAHGRPDAGYVVADTVLWRWADSLGVLAGEGRWLRSFDAGALQMDRAGLSARGVDVDRVLEGIRADMAALPGVLRVDTRASLARGDTGDAVTRRWRRSFTTDGMAELFVTLRPGRVWGRRRGTAIHGQPTDDDTHVPLILRGPSIRPGRYASRAATVDIAPTLARLLGIQPAERVDGRVLREALR